MAQEIYIKAETFEPAIATAAEVGDWYANRINGKVVVQYGNQELVVWCRKFEDDSSIYAYGFVGKYRTGNKLWNATMSANKNCPTTIWFGRDDRIGNFSKTNCVWYMPEKFFN